MPLPLRTKPGDYQFHVYDYHGSQPWTLSGPLGPNPRQRFYSMLKDLWGLEQHGLQNNVPNIHLGDVAAQFEADAKYFLIKVISFGSLNPTDPKVLITGGIHAREWVAPEMAYLLAEYLIKNYPANGIGQGVYQQRLASLVKSRRIHIIPMLNPAGNDFSVNDLGDTSRLWRRNRKPMPDTAARWLKAIIDPNTGEAWGRWRNAKSIGEPMVTQYEVPLYAERNTTGAYKTEQLPNSSTTGVDLNRNYQTNGYGYECATGPNHWDGIPKNDLNGDTYFGPEPASEYETKKVQVFLANCGPLAASIDYHSYQKAILYPTEAWDTGAVNPNFQNLGEILQALIRPRWLPPISDDYKLGPTSGVLDYTGCGLLPDYIHQNHRSCSFTIELDPAPGEGSDGWKLPADQIQAVFEKNIRGALALIMAAGSQVNVTPAGLFRFRTINSPESELLGWEVWDRGNQLPE